MAQQFPVSDDSGPVPPQQPFSYQPGPASTPPPRDNRRTLTIVLVVLLVLCLCIVGAGLLMYFVVGDWIINMMRGYSYLGLSLIIP